MTTKNNISFNIHNIKVLRDELIKGKLDTKNKINYFEKRVGNIKNKVIEKKEHLKTNFIDKFLQTSQRIKETMIKKQTEEQKKYTEKMIDLLNTSITCFDDETNEIKNNLEAVQNMLNQMTDYQNNMLVSLKTLQTLFSKMSVNKQKNFLSKSILDASEYIPEDQIQSVNPINDNNENKESNNGGFVKTVVYELPKKNVFKKFEITEIKNIYNTVTNKGYNTLTEKKQQLLVELYKKTFSQYENQVKCCDPTLNCMINYFDSFKQVATSFIIQIEDFEKKLDPQLRVICDNFND